MTLSWQDNATNETGFYVERAPGGTSSFVRIATLSANVTTYQNTGLTSSTSYSYRVQAYNGVGVSGYSNTASVTTLGATATRFANNASYIVVYLTIDGAQQFPYSPLGIAPGYYYEVPLSPGTHSYEAWTGFWDVDGTRFALYRYTATFTQLSGVTGSIPFNDPTITQLLTRFSSSGYWSGSFYTYNPVVYHTAGFRFFSNGSWDLYVDGVKQSSGTYSLVSRSPAAFSVTFTVGGYQGTLWELFGYFSMYNGPSDWPLIEYYYQGS